MTSVSSTAELRTNLHDVEKGLQQRFSENMQFFREKYPEVFRTVDGVQLENLGLLIEDDGSIQLVDSLQKPVYPERAEDFSRKQVANFLAKPQVTDNRFGQTFVRNPNHVFIKRFNKSIEVSQRFIDTEVQSNPTLMPLLLHCNVGLGFHLKMLLEACEINHLYIIERNVELFLVSFFTLDWKSIVEYFTKKNRSIGFFINSDDTETVLKIRLVRDRIGLHNIVNTFIYSHLQFEESNNFVGLYIKQSHHNLSGVGFFDDEQTGMAHTAVNLKARHCYFKSCPKFNNKQTALIVGNGPSLDGQIKFIKKNRDKAIILSCGTGLSSLYKAGIKPDFHIETERNKHLTDWIEQGTSEEFRKGITLLCLNTVSPEVIALFDKACIAKKALDAGESLIDSVFGESTITPLSGCNPTVSNAGVVFSLNMGFKTLVLVGVDLGMKPDGYHHSSLSIYKEIEDKAGRKNNCALEKKKGKYLVNGNFGGQVLTNTVLDNSAQIMTNMVGLHRQKYDSVFAYNVNDGARIPGFEPKLSKVLKIKRKVDKLTAIENIKRRCFVKTPRSDELVEATLSKNFEYAKKIKSEITLKQGLNNMKEIASELDRVFYIVKKAKDQFPIAYYLLKGSVSQYCGRIMRSCVFQQNDESRAEVYDLLRTDYIDFIESAFQFLDENPLKLDDTAHDSIAALKKINETS